MGAASTVVSFDLPDVYAPSPVTDLSGDFDREAGGPLVLGFTAPGDDFKSGVAAAYDLRFASNPEDLEADFSSCQAIDPEDLIDPSTLGAPEVGGRFVSLEVADGRATFGRNIVYFAIKVQYVRVNKSLSCISTES